MRPTRTRAWLGLLVMGLLTLAACTRSGTGNPVTSPAPSPAMITIQDSAFHGDLTVAPGARVTVRNRDSVAHTLTARDGSFDTGSIAGDHSVSFTAPTKPGNYPIGCKFHPAMSGTLIVGGTGAATPSRAPITGTQGGPY
jgi:plastocyanin